MKKSFRILLLAMMLCLAHTAQAQIVFSTFKLKPTLLYNVKSLHLGFTCKGEKQVKYVKIEWCAVNEVGDVSTGMSPTSCCARFRVRVHFLLARSINVRQLLLISA